MPKPIVNKQLEELCREMTGEPDANPFTAIEQWQRERETLAEFQDENQALSILNRRLILTLGIAQRVLLAMTTEAGLWMSDKTRKLYDDFGNQMKIIERTITQSKEINHHE